MPVSSGLGQKQHLALAQQAAALAHQQQAAVSNQGHHLHGSYMLPMAAASSGTLPGFDPSPHMMPQQHGGGMLQLSQGGGDMTQHYMPPPTAYPQQHGGPLVLPALTAVPAGSSQQQGLSEATADGKRRRGPRPRVFKKHTCQSDGCTVDLAPLSFYLQRNHICPVRLGGAGSCCCRLGCCTLVPPCQRHSRCLPPSTRHVPPSPALTNLRPFRLACLAGCRTT
jgi:hypothetical protein